MSRLIEIPARLEADDNIVAFWIPAEPIWPADRSANSAIACVWGDL